LQRFIPQVNRVSLKVFLYLPHNFGSFRQKWTNNFIPFGTGYFLISRNLNVFYQLLDRKLPAIRLIEYFRFCLIRYGRNAN
jgi:hypothetical protein